MGQTTHALIYEGLRRGLQRPTGRQLLDLWRELGLGREELAYYLVERQVAVNRADIYFNLFAPPPEWKVVGFEVPFEESAAIAALPDDELRDGDSDHMVSGRFDILFETPQGIVPDELKTGRRTLTLTAGLSDQINRYHAALVAREGDGAGGIRVCLLMDPYASFFVAPTGVCTPLLAQPSGAT